MEINAQCMNFVASDLQKCVGHLVISPHTVVARDAMDQYVNIELSDGAVARGATDQYVNIELADEAVARDATD